MRRFSFFNSKLCLLVPSLFLVIAFQGRAQDQEASKPAQNEGPRYTEKVPSRGGQGKVYLGREIAKVMGHQGLSWLERPEREEEEATNDVVENMGLEADDVVADIGAGSGYFTFRIAPRVPEGKVLAVDIQPEMLDYLNDKKKRMGVSNVETLLGDVDDTRLPENTVDAVLLVDAYHEFSHPWEMMRSIYKGLKPGGRVILLEYRAEDPAVQIKPLHKMTEQQAILEMKAAGLKHVETREFLPIQHFMVFTKPE